MCFLESSEEAMSFVTINFKGNLNVYKIKNLEYPSIDTCTIDWSTNVTDVLRTQSQNA